MSNVGEALVKGDEDAVIYGEASIYVRAPEGAEVDEAVLEAALKATLDAVYKKAVKLDNEPTTPVE